MVEDNKLAIDEAERIAQYEAVKRAARQDVQTEIAHQPAADGNADQLSQIGKQMREQAVTEVAATEREVAVTRVAARGSQVIDYLFYFIYGIIGLEILFDLLGARKTNGIREIVNFIATPLLAPFRNLLPDPATGRFQFRLSYLMALVIYMLLHLAITGLLRLIAQRRTAI